MFSELINFLVIVINPEDKEAMARICEPYINRIEIIMVNGGDSRQDSVYNGIEALPESVEIVLIHDGARPFVNQDIIENSINKAREFGSACAGLPAKDTIKIVDDKRAVKSTPERISIWHAQTPQSFEKSIIMRIYENAREKGIIGTDDAELAESAGFKVIMFEGSNSNIKLTTAEDLILGEYFIGLSKTEF